uniref:Uncharacterized protein n=1 Tax=Cacopsylla melanoneura TaxID=428564 RepID=A0A8D8RZU1_9HEMI
MELPQWYTLPLCLQIIYMYKVYCCENLGFLHGFYKLKRKFFAIHFLGAVNTLRCTSYYTEGNENKIVNNEFCELIIFKLYKCPTFGFFLFCILPLPFFFLLFFFFFLKGVDSFPCYLFQ